MKRLHLRDALCACVLLFVFSHTTFAATVQYQYTGNVFDTNDPTDPLCAIGAPGCFNNITATVELPTVLAANLILGANQVSSNTWSISDGRTTIDQTSGFNYSLSFGTDAFGDITGWSFNVSAVTQVLVDQLSSMKTTTSFDDTRYCATFNTSTNSCTANAIASANTAGSWAVSTVPIPAAVWLFASGLVGLFGLARRRRVTA